MKRRFVPIQKAAEVAGAYNPKTDRFEWWLVDIENMGFCKDGVTLSLHRMPVFLFRALVLRRAGYLNRLKFMLRHGNRRGQHIREGGEQHG